MQATEKKLGNKIWMAALSVGVVIAIILGVIGIVDHNDTKANAIPTINQQVDNIKNTLPELEAVSEELTGYIDTLETTVEKLQTDLTAVDTAIDTLETEVYGKVDAEKTATLNQLKADKTELEGKIAAAIKDRDADVADLQKQLDTVNANITALKTELDGKIAASEKKVLDELNALKTSIEGQITTINTDIAALKVKDTELDGKITDLKAYVDGEITASENWANATFATLEKYEEVQTEISAIKTAIDNLNKWNQQTDSLLAQKFEDIDNAIEALRTELGADYAAKIEAAVTEITGAYTEAIATAKSDITAAYTKAIEDAISASETSMQEWVKKLLADSYYDIADIDEMLTELEAKLTGADEDLAEQIEELQDTIAELETKIADLEEQLDPGYIYDATTNTYSVYSAEGLYAWNKALENDFTANLVLAADIILPNKDLTTGEEITVTDGKPSGSNWNPFGFYDYNVATYTQYNGTINGGGHTISGMRINTDDQYTGLVKVLGGSGSIKNLTIEDVVIYSTKSYVAAFAGANYGIIENCHVRGEASSIYGNQSDVGGIAGYMNNNAGDAEIVACSNMATVTGRSLVGGIVGVVNDMSTNKLLHIIGCWTKDTYESDGSNDGIGNNNNATVDGVFSFSDTTTANSKIAEMNQALENAGYSYRWETVSDDWPVVK